MKFFPETMKNYTISISMSIFMITKSASVAFLFFPNNILRGKFHFTTKQQCTVYHVTLSTNPLCQVIVGYIRRWTVGQMLVFYDPGVNARCDCDRYHDKPSEEPPPIVGYTTWGRHCTSTGSLYIIHGYFKEYTFYTL